MLLYILNHKKRNLSPNIVYEDPKVSTILKLPKYSNKVVQVYVLKYFIRDIIQVQ